MTDKVVDLDCVTRLDLPSERVLQKAIDAAVQEVVVIGYDKDGEFYFASSKADGGDVLWLLEQAKKRLMEICE